MRSALYYPHTTVESVELVKSALLLWDRLEFIVPWTSFRAKYDDPLVERAMELIGRARYPSDAEKREAHEHIEDLVTRPLPPDFFLSTDRPSDFEAYEIYPQKLLPETWHLLRDFRMTGPVLANADYPTTEPTGLTVMSILADCCAGATRSRVTDRGSAYATLAGVIGADTGQASSGNADVTSQLIPISLEVIDVASIDLKKLIEYREREQGRGGSDYTQLRHRYLEGLETYVKKLTSVQGRASDAEEIKRHFQSDMKIDLVNLKSELGFAKRDALFSNEILVTALAAAGSVAMAAFGLAVPILGALTFAGAPAAIGGLFGAGNKYFSARRAILQKHPMAYLYALR